MAVYTKLNEKEIQINRLNKAISNIGELNFIFKGNSRRYRKYSNLSFIRTKKGKFILTIFENRVDIKRNPLFYQHLMKFT